MSDAEAASASILRFTAKVMAAGIAAIALTLAASSFFAWKWSGQIHTVISSQVEVLTAAERLEHYGSVLELSMKQVVAIGDPEAAARYRAVQPQLRRTLNRLRAELQLSPSSRAAAMVDSADLALVAMEYQALELAGHGRLAEAASIIHGERYEQLVGTYVRAIREIERQAGDHLAEAERDLNWYLSAIVATRLATFGLLLVGWIAVVRRAGSWATELQDARDKARSALDELVESRAELERANRKLFNQARIDPLTGLHGRLKLDEDLEQIPPRVSRHAEGYTLVMCDVDRFKQYNDTYGHPAGDEVLRAVADAFTSIARAGDGLYRYGGEEFVLVLRTASVEAGAVCAERYRAAVEALGIPHGGSAAGVVTVSMGAAQFGPGDVSSVERWIERADEALYEAKRSGRNRVESVSLAAA